MFSTRAWWDLICVPEIAGNVFSSSRKHPLCKHVHMHVDMVKSRLSISCVTYAAQHYLHVHVALGAHPSMLTLSQPQCARQFNYCATRLRIGVVLREANIAWERITSIETLARSQGKINSILRVCDSRWTSLVSNIYTAVFQLKMLSVLPKSSQTLISQNG